MMRSVVLLGVLAGMLHGANADAESSDEFNEETGEMETTIKFELPKMTDEEKGFLGAPDHLKCEMCIAMAFNLQEALMFAENNMQAFAKREEPLSESNALEVLEGSCGSHTMKDYGLKVVNDENRLSGRGLKNNKRRGVVHSGEKWPARMHRYCLETIGKTDEMEFYNDVWRSVRGDAVDSFAIEVCVNHLKGDCVMKQIAKYAALEEFHGLKYSTLPEGQKKGKSKKPQKLPSELVAERKAAAATKAAAEAAAAEATANAVAAEEATMHAEL